MTMRHNRADLQGLELWVKFAANGESITSVTGTTSQDADVTLTDTGSGDYIITVNPFLGPKGEIYWQATTGLISTFASVTATAYTGDSLAVTIKVENDASTATDAIVCLHLYAE